VAPDSRWIYATAARDRSVARFAVAPQTRIAEGPRGMTRARRAVFRFRADEASRFKCRLTGLGARARLSRWQPCGSESFRKTGRQVYRNLRPGRKLFQARATDRAGTTDPTPAQRRWRTRG
jgi:hypothetical protein